MILDILFGKRHFISDPELGQFFSEKKMQLKTPVMWSHAVNVLEGKEMTQLHFEGTTTEIYPQVKSAYLYALEHYDDQIIPFIREKIIAHKDLLSFETMNFQWYEITGKLVNNNATLEWLGLETSERYMVRFKYTDHKIHQLQVT